MTQKENFRRMLEGRSPEFIPVYSMCIKPAVLPTGILIILQTAEGMPLALNGSVQQKAPLQSRESIFLKRSDSGKNM